MSEQQSTIHPWPLSTVILVVAIAAGCDTGGKDFFPLEDKRYWQYTIERTTMDGAKTQKYLLESLPARAWNGQRVLAKRTVDGHQYFYAVDDTWVKRVARQMRGDEAVTATIPALIVLPGTPQVGDSWQRSTVTAVLENTGPPWETLFRVAKPLTLDYTVASVTDTVRVAAGEFQDCVRTVGHGQVNADVGNYIGRARITVQVSEWYAPNVGLVRSERIETTDADVLNHGSIVMELETFR